MALPNTFPTARPGAERRTQARLHVQIPVRLQYSGDSGAHTLTLVDLSWGGALCESKTQLPGTDQPVWLLLPWKSNETIQIEATLLRQKALQDGRHLLALRFMRLSLLHQRRLEKLLELMQAQNPAGEAQEALPVVETLAIPIQTRDQWHWVLGDIARGILRIQAAKPYAQGQSLAIQLDGIPARARLTLRARVIDSKSAPMHDLYLLTLEFEHPLDALRGWAKWLLGQMPTEVEPPPGASHLPLGCPK
ncbi:MAG: PilZ domain-containing protein [Thermochromatium sp.]